MDILVPLGVTSDRMPADDGGAWVSAKCRDWLNGMPSNPAGYINLTKWCQPSLATLGPSPAGAAVVSSTPASPLDGGSFSMVAARRRYDRQSSSLGHVADPGLVFRFNF